MSLFLPGNRTEQIFLHQIAVLILVNQNLRKMLPVLPCNIAGFHFSILPFDENIQRKMLHIRKVHNFLFPLFLLHPPVKFQHKINQDRHRLFTCPPLLCRQNKRCCKKLLPNLLNTALYLIPDIFCQFSLYGRNTFVLFGRQPVKGNCRNGTFPFFQTVHPFQSFQLPDFLFQQFPVHIRTIRFLTNPFCLLQLFSAARNHPPDILCQIPAVIALADFLHALCKIVLLPFQKPFLRPRKAGSIPGQI